MIELSASQFEEIAIRIKDNQLYTDVFIELAPLLSQIETPVTWKDFLSRIDRKVNPPEKQPQKKIERYVFSSEKANLRYTDSGFIVKSEKLTRKQKEQIQEALDSIL
ncbi:hypothetical protein AVI56_15805 (plasmid) [Piscirickettsia salmonis]|nr:hypothetical protein [Piscirickettsia salmonis]APS71797.1 hypothetical protein AVI56_15805 [Piscirickettsia salmonis]KLV34971.1 hypothetical protein AB894_11050 [Piscirickettsia salmonis]